MPPTPAAAVACGTAANGSSHPQEQQQQQDQQPFTQDGVYLRHTAGHYALGGCSSPLALLWKDASCSRYLLVGGLGVAASWLEGPVCSTVTSRFLFPAS